MKEQIYISYHKDSGDVAARLISEALNNKGYTVFYDPIGSNRFDEGALQAITDCDDFILILSPGCLDSQAKNNMMVRETILAAQHSKNIIPVILPKFTSDNISDELGLLLSVYTKRVHFNLVYFDSSIQSIENLLVSKPSNFFSAAAYDASDDDWWNFESNSDSDSDSDSDFDSDFVATSAFLTGSSSFDSDFVATSVCLSGSPSLDSDTVCNTCVTQKPTTKEHLYLSFNKPCTRVSTELSNYWLEAFLGCEKSEKNEEIDSINVSKVEFSAIVPRQMVKGEYSMIDITVYENSYRYIVDRIIDNADGDVKEAVGSSKDISDNTEVRIALFSPDIDVSDCDEVQIWQGRYLTYSFPVEIPKDYAKRQILFIASVYFNGVIATKLKFIVDCTSVRAQKLTLTREDVLSAFISYASQDRSRVAMILQGMKKARPDMDIFFDIESLRSGEEWEPTLKKEIERRDVLFLCWSQYAKESKWVETEWRYALDNKGLDSIEPIPLVFPSECTPPDELKSKHFNDMALFYANK